MDEKIIMQEIQNSLQPKLKTEYGIDVTVTAQNVPKNNGTVRQGILISKLDSNVSPTLYVDDAINSIQGLCRNYRVYCKQIKSRILNRLLDRVCEIISVNMES